MYSDVVMEHFRVPRNVGQLPEPDAVGIAGEPGRGNFMVLHLAVSAGVVTACRFQTFGCAPAVAAGSVLTEAITGASVDDALALTSDQLEQALGGLPLGKRHCAALAIQALRDALAGD